MDWYQSLAKPSWTPAPRSIGLIWQILYPFMIVTFGYVFVQVGLGGHPSPLAWVGDLHEPADWTQFQRWKCVQSGRRRAVPKQASVPEC